MLTDNPWHAIVDSIVMEVENILDVRETRRITGRPDRNYPKLKHRYTPRGGGE